MAALQVDAPVSLQTPLNVEGTPPLSLLPQPPIPRIPTAANRTVIIVRFMSLSESIG
jgi:hypothetical protein